MKIIISRTDNLGDVALTLPLAFFLKQQSPQNTIYFIGKAYTRPLIACAEGVDFFLDKDDLLQHPEKLAELQADAIIFVFPDKDIARIAQKAKIPLRIGTSRRWWHWWYINKRVDFSRKQSDLHEAQLNFKLLKPLGYDFIPALPALAQWQCLKPPVLPEKWQNYLPADRLKVILHPKSKGSGREWGVEKFYKLILQNPDIQFFITGIAQESEAIRREKPAIFELPNVVDLAGKMDLSELIAFIAHADALVASGTGPVHIAAALGIKAIGIYPPMKPIHPARWLPVGRQGHYLVLNKDCNACTKSLPCHCMEAIEVSAVEELLLQVSSL